jgi:hypothetical protein
MMFLDEPNKRVILSVRKCGLMSVMHTVTDVYKNRCSSKKYMMYNFDTFAWHTNDQRIQPLEKDGWKDYHVTLIIREPYERYISGLRTLWHLNWLTNEPQIFKDWFHASLELAENKIHFQNGHTHNWLYQTDDFEYKSLEVINTKDLTWWLPEQGFLKRHAHSHKSNPEDLQIIEEFIQNGWEDRVREYLEPDTIMYNKWLTSPLYSSKITS